MIITADEKLPPPPPYEAYENQEGYTSTSRQPIEPSSSIPVPQSPPRFPEAPSVAGELTRDSDILIQAYLPNEFQAHFSQPPLRSLPMPICLPQTSPRARWDSPFARGYNESLRELGIPQEVFLNFVDGLNHAIAASPPLRVVDLTGKAIGYVPYHWAMVSGVTTQTAGTSQTGTHVLSKTLTDRYLRAANKNLFRPKGLSVRICTTLAMESLLRRGRGVVDGGSSAPGPSKLDKVGRAVGEALLHLPIPIVGNLTSRIIHAVADKPPVVAQPSYDNLRNGALTRRLARTEGVALPLTVLDHISPTSNSGTGAMNTLAPWGHQRLESEAERRTEERRRALAAERMGFDLRMLSPGMDSPRRMRREFNREARSHMRRERRERMGRGSGGLLSLALGPKLSPMERRVANSDLLEYWADEKVLWVVLMSSENDAAINFIEKADETENEEQVDEKSWKKEMDREREDLEDDLDELDELEHLQHDTKKPAGSF
ncbi:hypothetical protein L218DRAFT_402042 [Marasmius fiardii PR-910]|nr:hypothetical protein L218DRAFT_402042 [Marasmius fiardii PR-910]